MAGKKGRSGRPKTGRKRGRMNKGRSMEEYEGNGNGRRRIMDTSW